MKIIDLPIVDSDIDPLSALHEMVRHGRTAVIVARDQGHVILSAEAVLQAHRTKSKGLNRPAILDMPGFLPDMASVVSPSGWAGRRGLKTDLLRSVLKDSGATSALVGFESGKRGWVLTEHNDLARRLARALVLCTCPVDPNDVFQSDDVDAGGMCPNHPNSKLDCR